MKENVKSFLSFDSESEDDDKEIGIGTEGKEEIILPDIKSNNQNM